MECNCKFNGMVDCMKFECWKCGWNPSVSKERIKEWETNRRIEAEKKNK